MRFVLKKGYRPGVCVLPKWPIAEYNPWFVSSSNNSTNLTAESSSEEK